MKRNEKENAEDIEIESKKARVSSAVARLSNDVLIIVFEQLSSIERLRVEPVCKNWRNLLTNGDGWHKYSVVSHKVFPDGHLWTNTMAKFSILFERCGRFVKELSTRSFNVNSDLYALLPKLPNLRHVELEAVESAHLIRIAELYPNLLSLAFSILDKRSLDGVTAVLKQCQQLEMLGIRDGSLDLDAGGRNFGEYNCPLIPSTLKCLSLEVLCSSFISQLASQRVPLISIGIYKIIDFRTLSLIDCSKLRYLSVNVNETSSESLSYLLRRLSNLQAIGVSVELENETDEWADKLWKEIAGRCPNLQHFGLYELGDRLIRSNNFVTLSDLSHLVSVHVNTFAFHESHQNVVVLLEKLSSVGKLKYFQTNVMLPMDTICQALVQCKNLIGLFCSQLLRDPMPTEEYDVFAQTLHDIHKDDQTPESVLDERILHTDIGARYENHEAFNNHEHPWVKFYGYAPSNKIGEQIQYGELTEKPHFAGF